MDFLAKPVDPDHLLLLVARALEQRRIVTENLLMKEELAVRRGAPQLVGEDPSLRKVFASLQRAAATDATVLLEGESGTGKELFARSLHALSPRADAPFVAINCAAIPENLLETELFGYEKGAFTGAVGAQAGQVRDGASRHAVPRRDRRSADVAAGEDSARAGRKAVRARRRHRAPCRSTCGSWPRRTRACAPRWRRAASARISTSACRCFRSPFRRCATAPATSRAGAVLRRAVLPRPEEAAAGAVARGARAAADVPLAGQRARAAELHRARGDPGRRRHDPAAASEPLVRRAAAADENAESPWAHFDLSGTLPEVTRRVTSRWRERRSRRCCGRPRQQGARRGTAADQLQDAPGEAQGAWDRVATACIPIAVAAPRRFRPSSRRSPPRTSPIARRQHVVQLARHDLLVVRDRLQHVSATDRSAIGRQRSHLARSAPRARRVVLRASCRARAAMSAATSMP